MIHYRNDVRKSGVDGRALRATAKRLLAAAGEAGSSLSLTLVGDDAMRELNREHRGKDVPTDVLSFPLDGPSTSLRYARDDKAHVEHMIGDVVISIDTARKQAADYDAPLQRELERLLIHGILHVLGHDHMETDQREKMESEERRLASSIGMPWPFL